MWYIEALAGWVAAGIWTYFAFEIFRFFRKRLLTRSAAALPGPAEWPRISVIVPARDEEENIEACIRSLAGLGYPDLEIIAVNDRSSDRTGGILERLAGEIDGMTVLHVDRLPDDWLGKPHAMHTGAERATGEYLLFTDGDITFRGPILELAVKQMAASGLDHLFISPIEEPGNFLENSLFAYYMMMGLLALRPRRIPDPKTNNAGGIGAFNMIRRDVYRRTGGFARIRLDVLDDLKLGRLVKKYGYRQDVYYAEDLLSVRWFDDLGGYFRNLEKNFFAAFHYSLKYMVFGTGLQVISHAVPYAGLLLYRDVRIAGFALATLIMHGLVAYIGRKEQFTWAVTFMLPVSALLMIAAHWRSVVLTLKRGGVRWRDRFYPLDILRENVYR